MKSATMDIETTDLAAVGAGVILCACIKPAKEGIKVFRLDEYLKPRDDNFGLVEREETALLKDLMAEMSKYEILVGHNLVKFDFSYIKSRAFQRGLSCPPAVIYDTLTAFRRTGYLTVPNRFGKPSGGLDMVTDFLGVRQRKTKIYPRDWWETIWGKKAKRIAEMNEVVEHCIGDVKANADIFPFLWAADPRPTLKKVY